jgi:hypothetical protein
MKRPHAVYFVKEYAGIAKFFAHRISYGFMEFM